MDIRLPFPEKSLSERIEAVKETAVHSGFPLRGEYSVFDRGSRTKIPVSELVSEFNEGEVQYRYIQKKLTSE